MLRPRFVAGVVSIGITALNAGLVSGQSYPNKPVRIVTNGAGGGADLISRLIAQGITGSLGQPVIIDNRPSGIIPVEIVSKAPPDGYTLLVSSSGVWLSQFLQKVPYDTVRDFSTVTLAARAPNVLVVHPSLPAKSVKELIALAKAKPGELNYSTGTTGGAPHLSAELFKSMAGINIVRVPYKSGSVETADLLGGYVQLTFGAAGAVTPHVKVGKLRALAVTSAQPSVLFPGLPTMAESGLSGYESASSYIVLAPAGTPATIINRLNEDIVRFLNTAEAKERLFSAGAEAVGNSPAEFAAFIKSDMAVWGKLIRDIGIKAD